MQIICETALTCKEIKKGRRVFIDTTDKYDTAGILDKTQALKGLPIKNIESSQPPPPLNGAI
jgi:hypothetical protein